MEARTGGQAGLYGAIDEHIERIAAAFQSVQRRDPVDFILLKKTVDDCLRLIFAEESDVKAVSQKEYQRLCEKAKKNRCEPLSQNRLKFNLSYDYLQFVLGFFASQPNASVKELAKKLKPMIMSYVGGETAINIPVPTGEGTLVKPFQLLHDKYYQALAVGNLPQEIDLVEQSVGVEAVAIELTPDRSPASLQRVQRVTPGRRSSIVEPLSPDLTASTSVGSASQSAEFSAAITADAALTDALVVGSRRDSVAGVGRRHVIAEGFGVEESEREGDDINPLVIDLELLSLSGYALTSKVAKLKEAWRVMCQQSPQAVLPKIKKWDQFYRQGTTKTGRRMLELFREIAGLHVSLDVRKKVYTDISAIRWGAVPGFFYIRPFYLKSILRAMRGKIRPVNGKDLDAPSASTLPQRLKPTAGLRQILLAACLEYHRFFHPRRTKTVLHLPLSLFLNVAKHEFPLVKTTLSKLLGSAEEVDQFLTDQHQHFSNLPEYSEKMALHALRWHGRKFIYDGLVILLQELLDRKLSIEDLVKDAGFVVEGDDVAAQKCNFIKKWLATPIGELIQPITKAEVLALRKEGRYIAVAVRTTEVALVALLGAAITTLILKMRASSGRDTVDACSQLAFIHKACTIAADHICTVSATFSEPLVAGSNWFWGSGRFTTLFSPWEAALPSATAVLNGTTAIFNAIGECYPGASLSLLATVANSVTGEPQTCVGIPFPIHCNSSEVAAVAERGLRGAAVMALTQLAGDESGLSNYIILAIISLLLVGGTLAGCRWFNNTTPFLSLPDKESKPERGVEHV